MIFFVIHIAVPVIHLYVPVLTTRTEGVAHVADFSFDLILAWLQEGAVYKSYDFAVGIRR